MLGSCSQGWVLGTVGDVRVPGTWSLRLGTWYLGLGALAPEAWCGLGRDMGAGRVGTWSLIPGGGWGDSELGSCPRDREVFCRGVVTVRYTRRHVWVAGLEEGEDPLPEEVREATQYSVVDPDGQRHIYGDQEWVKWGGPVRDGDHPEGVIEQRLITLNYGSWQPVGTRKGAGRMKYEVKEGWELVIEAEAVTVQILAAAEEVIEGWPQARLEDVLTRIEGIELRPGVKLDLGPSASSPAILKIEQHLEVYRKAVADQREGSTP